MTISLTRLPTAIDSVAACARAEMIKLRSSRFHRVALLAALALTLAASVIVAASIAASAANGYDITASAATIAADAMTLGQLPVLMIAILAMTAEYANGAIRLSLRGTPLRGQLLLAKTAVVGSIAFLTGLVLAGLSMIISGRILGDTDAVTLGEAIRCALGVGGYLALVSVLVIGIATISRSTIVSILITLLLLLAVPMLSQVSNAAWLEGVRTYLPSTAGAIVMSPENGDYGIGAALGIMATWAALAQFGAYIVLWLRDA